MPPLSLLAALLTQTPCGPLDLATALDLAARRSDEVAIKQAEAATAQVDLALARSLAILPIASAQLLVGPDPAARGDILNATGNTNRSLNDLGVFERIDVQAIQPLWTWGQLSGARDAAAAGIRARQSLVEDTLSQVQLRVIQLYWGDALARRFLAIADDIDANLAQVDRQIDKSLKAEDGAVSPSDKYQVQLFKSELVGRKAEAVRARELARIGLAATLAIDRAQLKLAEVDLAPTAAAIPPISEALTQAQLSRPDLRALAAGIDAKKAEVQIKEGALYPQLFIGAQFAYSYAYNRDIQLNPWVSDYFNTLSVGAALGVRQDLGLATLIQQKKKAQAELSALEAQEAGLRRLIETQVEGDVAELVAAQARAKASVAGLSAGKSWFRSAGLDFEAGVGDAKGLLTAYRGYVESQVTAAQAAYDVIVAKARLDQAMAVPLASPLTGEPQCTLSP